MSKHLDRGQSGESGVVALGSGLLNLPLLVPLSQTPVLLFLCLRHVYLHVIAQANEGLS